MITADQCLCDSFNKVIEAKKELVMKVTMPNARLTTQSPHAVADCILDCITKE